MDERQRELWTRLEAFEIGPPGAALTFTARLACECAWSGRFAAQVVREYKRFLLLAVSAGHPVTPPEEIDQAWHLHLAYTESYWNELCGDLLGRPLHHRPTRGGAAEDAKFREWYTDTLRSYERVFGQPPPRAIWPTPEVRFADGARFRRVDHKRAIVLARTPVLALATAAAAGLALSCAPRFGADGWAGMILAVLLIAWAGVVAWRGDQRKATRDGKHNDSGSGCAAAGSDGCGSDGGSGCGASGCGGGCGGGD